MCIHNTKDSICYVYICIYIHIHIYKCIYIYYEHVYIYLGVPERQVGLLFASTGISLADHSEKSEL